jgi:hypothetical protein
MGRDVLHTQRELQRGVHGKWQRAERQLESTTEADHKVAHSKQHGHDACGVAQHARRVWHKAERDFDEAVQTEGVVRRVAMALAVFRPDGKRNDRAWAQAQLREATKLVVGPEWSKVRRLLSDERTLYALDWLHAQLAEAVEDPLWREVCARLWSLRETRRHTPGEKRVRLAQLAALEQAMGQCLWPEWPSAYARVQEKLSQVVRASSAVECINSVMRMHQVRHRHVSQGMLDLKRLYWNCRTFRHGKHKKTCPYELLGLKLSTYSWWPLLQLAPQGRREKLSTHRVTA